MWKVANCSPSRSSGEISAANRVASPVRPQRRPAPPGRPRAALAARGAPAQAVHDRVRGEREQHDRRERPRGVDGHERIVGRLLASVACRANRHSSRVVRVTPRPAGSPHRAAPCALAELLAVVPAPARALRCPSHSVRVYVTADLTAAARDERPRAGVERRSRGVDVVDQRARCGGGARSCRQPPAAAALRPARADLARRAVAAARRATRAAEPRRQRGRQDAGGVEPAPACPRGLRRDRHERGGCARAQVAAQVARPCAPPSGGHGQARRGTSARRPARAPRRRARAAPTRA